MTTRPTGACLVLVTQVNMVRGPHPTERGAKGCSWSGQRLRSVAPPAGIGPPVLTIQSLSSGACGSCPYSGETVTEWPLLPRSGSCGGGHNAGAAGHSAILRARQLGSQALLFAPQRVCVIPQAFAFRVRQPPHCLQNVSGAALCLPSPRSHYSARSQNVQSQNTTRSGCPQAALLRH
jgi:hypothetical protein